jgi:hypothetical protein
MSTTTTFSPLPLGTRTDRAANAGWSDAHLVDAVAECLARPKRAPADSFVLHAPLELLARTALLPHLRPAARAEARARLVWLGDSYAAAGDESGERQARTYEDPAHAVAQLLSAIARGEIDDADQAASWLATTISPVALARALADDVIPRLSAAAHGPIFLYHLPRIAPRSRACVKMLRGLVRELARAPEWRLVWQTQRSAGAVRSDDLVDVLLAPPSPGDPGSPFIYPTMSLVEASGLAQRLLDSATRSLDTQRANRLLSRIAAWSMLQDDPNHAPYGWSHCLSMPQAVLGIADLCVDPGAAIAVAATYVLGFRATLGRSRLDPAWRPERPRLLDPLGQLHGSPADAAAGVWYAADDAVPEIVAELAARAARHHDAHLAKYTLACFDAASTDPAGTRLYLCAAAYLGAWWEQQDIDARAA